MGQHKTNPTAIAAKERRTSAETSENAKKELERLLYLHAKAKIAEKTGLPDYILGGIY